MADTGSEIAESGTRDATGIFTRLLERELMMRFTKLASTVGKTAEAGEAPTNIEVGVRCPEGDLDARAEEILEALERDDVRATCAIDDASSSIHLAVSPTQGEAMLRAFERLSASSRSGFAIDDVTNVELLETIVGRRALGTTHRVTPTIPSATRGEAEPVESVALTFANHPEEPSLDESQAAAYARRMAELGFDTSHRPIDTVRRDADGRLQRAHAHIVGVSYLTRERDSFLAASAVSIHELGIPTREDPFASDRSAFEAALGRLLASAEARREAFAHNHALAADAPRPMDAHERTAYATREAKSAEQAANPTTDDGERELSAEEYEAMPPRERAKVDPNRIPDAAFGGYRASDVAREQTEVASAMREHATPARSQPDIGGR